MHNDLATHLRKWGLKVEESAGWQNRGRPYAFHPRAVVCHHTASNKHSGNFASESVVTHGRSDLPGPLCQVLLGRDGTVKVIAGGYANHAGEGGPLAGIPHNVANSYAWGIEAENNGVGEKWSSQMLNAYYRLTAALLNYSGVTDVSKAFGHKEWTTRKIDPAGINMAQFRDRVRAALAAGPNVPSLHLSKLKPGVRSDDVVTLKEALHKKGFFPYPNRIRYYGPGLRSAVRKFQEAQGWTGADADGVPGPVTLELLGFVALP